MSKLLYSCICTTLLIQCTLINGATVKVVDNLISRLLLSLYILERNVGFYIMQQVLESTFPQQHYYELFSPSSSNNYPMFRSRFDWLLGLK